MAEGAGWTADSVDPWEKIRPATIRQGASDPGEAVVWERDDGGGNRTEVSVTPHNGGFVRAAQVGRRGGTHDLLKGKPDDVRARLVSIRQVLYQVEKALELLGPGS